MMQRRENALLVFVRDPAAEPVKTRLFPTFTPRQAADFYRAMVADVLATHADQDGHDTIVCYTPAEAERSVREWLGEGAVLWRQEGNDLGERQQHAINCALAKGYNKAVVIGSDIPHLPAAAVDGAFEQLDRSDAVVGPAEDGGYYLIGAAGPVDPLFVAIPWGSDRVLAETLERARAAGMTVATLEESFDIDTFDDARRLFRLVQGGGPGNRAAQSVRFLETFFGDG